MLPPALTHREFPGLGRLYFHRAAGAETRFIHKEIVLDGDYLKHGITVGPGDVVFDAEWPRIRQIVIEAHDVDGRVAAITPLLRDRGYQVVSEQPPWARSAALDNTNLYARRPG